LPRSIPEFGRVCSSPIILQQLSMKPYQHIAIRECHQPLVPIPLQQFAVQHPHPYVALGAPYGDRSPYCLRQSVVERLLMAQTLLQQHCPGWQIQIFDAYRPLTVQQYMVDYTLEQLVRSHQLTPDHLTAIQRQEFLAQVYQFWAVPNHNPLTPPPHSTGAAIDITLATADGEPIDMGSPIDELSSRSYPDHYAPAATTTQHPPSHTAFHHHRQLLNRVMCQAEFYRHPTEWWHFSYGDQLWAWLKQQEQGEGFVVAQYGRVEEEG